MENQKKKTQHINEELVENEKETVELEDKKTLLEDDFDEEELFDNEDLKDYRMQYTIEGLYADEEGYKFKNKYTYRSNPPILYITDNIGNEASFALDKNTVKKLRSDLDEVFNALYGYRYSNKNFENELKIKDYHKLPEVISERIKNAPLKYGIMAVLVVIIMVILAIG